jgi:hypothetical protein
MAGGVAEGIDPEFKPQYCKKKKKVSHVRFDKKKHYIKLT